MQFSFSAKQERVIRYLIRLFERCNKPVYLVGGCVRNLLLGLAPTDFDIASPVLPDELERQARQMGLSSVRIVNSKLGTVLLKIEDEKIEHTTFRKESYAPGGAHMPEHVWIGATIQEDARRRDFSVNALYLNLQNREILDPTGRGLEDIQKKRLRSATTCPEEMICNDALRLLRLIRFACQLDFTVEKNLFQAAKKYARQISAISKERIGMEMNKIMLADNAYNIKTLIPPAQRAVILMESLNLLTQLVPEFIGYRDIGQCKYHKYNVFLHTANTVGYTPPDLVLRYAALFHDVGKPIVWKQSGRMIGHDKLGAEIVSMRLPRMGIDKQTTELVARLVREHMYDLTGQAREAKIRAKIQSMGYDNFERLILLREADFLGSGYEKKPIKTAEKFKTIMLKMKKEGTPMCIQELQITGKEIMQRYGIEGKKVGEVLNALFHECLLRPTQNTREKLLHIAARYI